MIERGVCFGACQDGQFVAPAEALLPNVEESVAAIGNVNALLAHRGGGHAAGLTAAVACELRRLGIETIALSVAADNHTAIAVYTGLGFLTGCPSYEGLPLAVARVPSLGRERANVNVPKGHRAVVTL